MKTKARFIIGIIIVLLGLVAIVVFIPDRSNSIVNEKRLEEINNYDLENNYPQTPFAVISVNNNIMSFLYSGSITDNLIEQVAKTQRKLFHEDFLELNSEDYYISALKLEIKGFKADNYKLISITQEPPIYNPNNEGVCSIDVIQYTNAKENSVLTVTYYLQKDSSGEWKILGFMPAEESAGFNG